MRLMRNKRTGRNAVYDQSCVDSGGWVPMVEEAPVAKAGKAGRRKTDKQTQQSGETGRNLSVDEIEVNDIFAPPTR
jgi:hypothetical protein